MKGQEIWIVVGEYTPYEHNRLAEGNEMRVFSSLRNAMEYIKGTDGNGRVMKYEERLPISLKEGCVPKFDISSGDGQITFKTDLSCLREEDIKQGGYIYKVSIYRDYIY